MPEPFRLLELSDELLVHHVFSARRGICLRDVASTCKRLCRLARSTVQAINIEEGPGQHWPAITFTGCKGLEYFASDEGVLVDEPDGKLDYGLPLLASTLPHVCQHWTALRELALVLTLEDRPGPHRRANQCLTEQLWTLTAIHSLRHLQLYKTAPLQGDAALLAQLTQLTSLLLADRSYMPGWDALVTVDLQPLSRMTNLCSLAVSGVCPYGTRAVKHAMIKRITEEQLLIGPGNTAVHTFVAGDQKLQQMAAVDAVEVLPVGLTSLVLKNFDAVGLDMWMPHVLGLKELQHLVIRSYSEPSGTDAFECFPAPIVSQLAPAVTALTKLSFSMPPHDNERTRAGYVARAARLPCSLSQLVQLRALELLWCQLSLHCDADWATIAALTQLTSFMGAAPLSVAPADMKLTRLQRLALEDISAADSNQAEYLAAACPQLEFLSLDMHRSSNFLAAAATITALCNLQTLGLTFKYRMDEASAAAFLQLGRDLQHVTSIAIGWAGGPDGWLLPRLHTFGQIKGLSLEMKMQMPGRVMQVGCYDPWLITDAALLAHLSPLLGLTQLELFRLPAITPAVLVALQGMMPKLRSLTVVECSGMQEFHVEDEWDAGPSWEGPSLQLALAAMQDAAWLGRPAVLVEGFTRVSEYLNRKRPLPLAIRHVYADERQF